MYVAYLRVRVRCAFLSVEESVALGELLVIEQLPGYLAVCGVTQEG